MTEETLAPMGLRPWRLGVGGGHAGVSGGASGKEPTCQHRRRKRRLRSLGREDPLEESAATHSSILPWEVPGTEEPGGVQSTGSQGAGHD